MQAIELLLHRNSHPKLVAPAPEGASLERLYQAALRAPDHGRLQPWHFIQLTGQGLARLGEIFAQAELAQNPDARPEVLGKLRSQPLRAPLIIAVAARLQEHRKVPASEQRHSAACAAHGLLLAAEAEGFAGIWRSGWLCFDPLVKKELGLQAKDELIGFIYLGTPQGQRKRLPEYNINDFVEKWN